ncbi:MAG TPA: SDR family NAD(P)-dependent oxidoreductase [Solirubrobacterales bacterium]|nr:SDR family NAD(P)-dependent oxidoreductase [Solirubrobacterales bacterium]
MRPAHRRPKTLLIGRIDAVFANAGFGAKRGFLEESPEFWKSMLLTNVYGAALTIRATLPHLLGRGDGDFLATRP